MKRTVILLVAIFVCLFSAITMAEGTGQYFAFSYFTGEGEEGLHMLISQDGLNWNTVNDGSPIYLQTLTGDNLMRDPSICKGPDGSWQLVWTNSWTSKSIGHSSSSDLIHWSESQEISVMDYEPTCRNTWAPEVYYDTPTEQYYIFWASTIPGKFSPSGTSESGYDHRFYFTTTKDFQTFAETKQYIDPGYNCIDGMMAKLDDTYYFFYKDERLERTTEEGKTVEGKSIWLTTGSSMEGEFSNNRIISPINWVEGPTAFRVGDKWLVLYDCYNAGHYGGVESTDGLTWTDITDQLSMPDDVRHGTVFEISESDYKALESLCIIDARTKTGNWVVDNDKNYIFRLTNGTRSTVTHTGLVSMNADGEFNIVKDATLIQKGAISGTGNIDKTGAGILTLSKSNLGYKGTMSVSEGTLALTIADAITNSSSVINEAAITMDQNQKLNNLSGENTEATITISNNKQLTLNNANDTAYAGKITGSGSLVKDGDKSLTLTNANDYSGQTTINTGTIKLTESGTVGKGDIVIETAGALDFFPENEDESMVLSNVISGTGKVNKTGNGTLELPANASVQADSLNVIAGNLKIVDAVTPAVSFALAPAGGLLMNAGSTARCVSLESDLNIATDGVLSFDFFKYSTGAEHDQYLITNDEDSFSLADGATILLNFLEEDASVWAANKDAKYYLVSDKNFAETITDLSEHLSGTYSDLFNLYGNNEGLYLQAKDSPAPPTPTPGVPEPSTWALLILGATALLWYRKRYAK